MKKFFIIFLAFILVLGFAGFYLYHLDKKTPRTGNNNFSNSSTKKINYFSESFWVSVTPEQLEKTLKNIGNINQTKNTNNRNLLHFLILSGKDPEMIDTIISYGINYKSKDNFGATPLHYAVIREKEAYRWVNKLLNYYDDNIDILDNSYGASPLIWALHNRQSIEVIQLLLEKEADPNLQTQNGSTPLIAASNLNIRKNISFIDEKAIQLLLDYKADISIKNSAGKTALDFMKENSDFKKTQLFKKLSAQK